MNGTANLNKCQISFTITRKDGNIVCGYVESTNFGHQKLDVMEESKNRKKAVSFF